MQSTASARPQSLLVEMEELLDILLIESVLFQDKCNDIKSDNASIDDTLTAVNDRFVRDSEKLTESEKTAMNVMCMLMPMVDALISSKRDETLVLHETKINRLQAGMRNNEYSMDALAQYSRKENVRVSGIKEVNDETDENIIDSILNIGAAMDFQLNPVTIVDAHRLGKVLGKTRQIISRFANRATRNRFISNRRKLKQSEDFKGVFISDDLTPLRFKLFQMVRKLEDVKTLYKRRKTICTLKTGLKPITRIS
ncbi:unnamed protein product [Mytilus edulis]|uniref:Uncharacterized protein n=1 Tax=Mytilus edulis TaxID=6550 RepID=A0A8S3QZQ2_MYTED|nr:unnamed protein product [Mytilus edulis]